MTPRRGVVLAVVGAVLVAGGVADRAPRPTATVSATAANRSLMPSSAPEGALASTWFCVGGTAAAGGAADGVVVIANPTRRPATGTVTVIPSAGAATAVPVNVAALSVIAVTLRDVVAAPFAAAVVDVDSGQVAAELVVTGPGESDATACSSRASDQWYFADGATAKDASLLLSLFNPFPEDAIVDLSFSTDQGRAAPAAFRPIVVPARSLVVREVGEHVRRRNSVATEVSVRTGRVVAAQTETRTAPGKAGLSVVLGAPSLGRLWHFPDGLVIDGVSERFAVSNPSATEANVLFQVSLEEGVAEDFERAVPARGRLDVILDEQVGVPKGVAHATTVKSLDGVPVVVARSLEAAPPAPRSGQTDTLGARRAASRWMFAAAGPSETGDEWVVVFNPGTRPATVSVTGLAAGQALAVEGLQDVTVGPGRRRALRIGDHVRRDPLPLVVTSTVPVVVERALFRVGSAGLWATMGIPLS